MPLRCGSARTLAHSKRLLQTGVELTARAETMLSADNARAFVRRWKRQVAEDEAYRSREDARERQAMTINAWLIALPIGLLVLLSILQLR
jgi:hypothetical protein